MATASRAALLVDASAYFRALRGAFEAAHKSILILGWDFDGGVVLDPPGSTPASLPLRDYLRDLLRRKPELEVRILVWGFSVVFAESQSVPPPLDPRWPVDPRLQFRYANDHPLGASHHEKVVCVDDALAFVGGIDLTAGRWDVATHDPHHPQRVGPQGEPYEAKHDIQIIVDGRAAASLAELARSRWCQVTGEAPKPVGGADPWPAFLAPDMLDVPVGIARTLPALGDRQEVREAEMLTRDALAAARQYVYAEAQYLTSVSVEHALGELLERPAGPDVVVVLRHVSDGVIQRFAMGKNRDRLIRRLSAHDRAGRLRIYYPAVADEGCADHDIHVHSKLLAIDDRLLKVGSSNWSNRSMGFDSECDLAVEARDERTRKALRQLTARLLAEHLDRTADEVLTVLGQRGLIAAVEELNRPDGRRLVPLAVAPQGPRRPLLGSFLVDPAESLRSAWRRASSRAEAAPDEPHVIEDGTESDARRPRSPWSLWWSRPPSRGKR